MPKKLPDFVSRAPHYAGNNFYIRPTFVVSIPEWVSTQPKRGRFSIKSLFNLEKNQHSGDVSAKAQGKIRNAVNWLVQAAKDKRVFDKKTGKHFLFKVNFVTLSIPACDQLPDDNFVKKEVLHAFIVYCRKYYGLRNYVWRAEAQANGMIHFHICTDSFIHWRDIRKTWNRLLLKNGLLADHISRGGSEDPNSTDVHSVRGIQNLGAYIAKYVSKKQSDRRPLKGRLWGCNYELSHNVKTTAICDPEESAEQIRHLMQVQAEYKPLLSAPDALGVSRQIAELFFLPHKLWKRLQNTPIGKAYFERLFRIRTNTVTMPIEYYTINDEPCQSITQSIPKTGLLKSVRAFCEEQVTNVSNAVQQIMQLDTGTAQSSL